jgi:sugar phosphate isomerase/epimerase
MTRMRLGLAQGLVPLDPESLTPALAAEIKALGVSAITTHFEVPPTELRGPRGTRLASVLSDAGLRIVQYAGHRPNLVNPDDVVRRQSISTLGEYLLTASFLNADMVLTGCGSLHPDHAYGPARENHSLHSRDRLILSLKDLASRAENAGVTLALEAHCLTTLDTPERAREILDAVDSSWVRVNFDPVNFLSSIPAVYDSGVTSMHAAEVLEGRLAPTAHIKDVVLEADLVLHIAEARPGAGLLDLQSVLDTCRRFLPEPATLIVEHLGPADAAEAIAYVKGAAARAGISLI